MKTHGKRKTRVYSIWCNMKSRCKGNNKNNLYNYYLKGIKVCERWQSFENFYEDMGEPLKNQEIDRIDNSQGYFKENCRWVSRDIQVQNRAKNTHKKKGKRNNSGFIGVCYVSSRQVWQASYRRKVVGSLKSFEKAVMRRLDAEVKNEIIDSGLFKFLCD